MKPNFGAKPLNCRRFKHSALQYKRMHSLQKLTVTAVTLLLLLCCAAVPAAADEVPALKLSYEALDDNVFVKITANPENFNGDVTLKWTTNAPFAEADGNTYTALLRGDDFFAVWALGYDPAGNAAAAVYGFWMQETTITTPETYEYHIALMNAACKEIPLNPITDEVRGVLQEIGFVEALQACDTCEEKILYIRSVIQEIRSQ